jgi:hypothetical protein
LSDAPPPPPALPPYWIIPTPQHVLSTYSRQSVYYIDKTRPYIPGQGPSTGINGYGRTLQGSRHPTVGGMRILGT